ncbi:MAG: peptidoglycan DD-metalloendopeptidase family protein [Ignavibacteriales bacterium]|nr:MAG: peptidoglycan DD-metalloendopeptidase family protein [Ignavibacteriales bacterium]
MVIRIKYILPVLLPALFIIYSQEEIKEKQDELSDIKNEIVQLENELKQKNKKEKESYTVLEKYNRQSFLINKVISQLRSEEQLKSSQIYFTESEIDSLTDAIKRLQENYSHYVVSVYKYGQPNELLSLIDAESFNQALLRLKYLREFSKRRQNDLTNFNESKEQLIAAKAKLEQEKREKTELVSKKVDEEKNLSAKLTERKKILAAIRTDKNELKKEIEAKKQAEVKIKNLITKLIEDAERRKREEQRLLAEKNKNLKPGDKKETNIKNENDSSSDFNIDTKGLSSFAALRGKLNWPIMNGKVFRKFGESRNQKLNTVTLNYGIDIKASTDLNVKAVAEGVVSAIDWIPGYGSVIIITHKDEFRTVYSHLSEIFVNEGDKVKQGTLIAKVGESLDGNVLHFEIWNSRVYQNPETWLARK